VFGAGALLIFVVLLLIPREVASVVNVHATYQASRTPQPARGTKICVPRAAGATATMNGVDGSHCGAAAVTVAANAVPDGNREVVWRFAPGVS
jgi:hypothetical protein